MEMKAWTFDLDLSSRPQVWFAIWKENQIAGFVFVGDNSAEIIYKKNTISSETRRYIENSLLEIAQEYNLTRQPVRLENNLSVEPVGIINIQDQPCKIDILKEEENILYVMFFEKHDPLYWIKGQEEKMLNSYFEIIQRKEVEI